MVAWEEPVKKAEVLEVIDDLSDGGDVALDKLISALAGRREVERGLAAADAGDEIALEEFEEQSERWLAERSPVRRTSISARFTSSSAGTGRPPPRG